MGETQDPLLGRLTGIKRDEHFLEFNIVGPQRQPWPHRPGRIVLVTYYKRQIHLEKSLTGPTFCHSAPEVWPPLCRMGNTNATRAFLSSHRVASWAECRSRRTP